MDELVRHYAYPDVLDQPYVRVNFVASADGAAELHGRSDGLSGPADKQVFALLRALADVVLVGAGTARAEGYRGARRATAHQDLRAGLGMAPVPPIALVSASAAIDVDGPLFTDTSVPPIVFVGGTAPQDRIDALRAAGADVEQSDTDSVSARAALDGLSRRGLNRVLCEGGPRLLGGMIAEDVVDELCLTVAPMLAGGGTERISGPLLSDAPRPMLLAGALHSDGNLLLRYVRIG